MTRINANINPKHLIDQHLLAEYREIIRIPNVVNKKGNIDLSKIPKSFRLGTGHVLFFYDKNKYLHKRFISLKKELCSRNITNNITDEMFQNFNPLYYKDITDEMIDANKLIINRLIENIRKMKRHPTINGQKIDIDNYFNMLREIYNK